MKPIRRQRKRFLPSHLIQGFAAVLLLLLLCWPSSTLAQEAAPSATPDTAQSALRYRVYLLTVGQGEEVWELFGHNALLIVDNLTGDQLAWNWGLFNFEDTDFLPRFLQGTMRYTMGPAEVDPFLRSYSASQRTVFANEILLTQDEAAALDAFVRHNFLPENRPYIYHYFEDNCSTRVRDALDGVLGGYLREQFVDRTTPYSYRWHSRRLVQVEGWVDQGLSFLLGTRGDRPITEWESMFAPLELMELLEGVQRVGPDGEARALLGPRVTVVESARPTEPQLPPTFSPLSLALGLALGLAIAGLSYVGGRGARWARVGAQLGIVGWGLFSGFLGLLLLSAWLTDHEFIRWNLNLFYLSPLGLPLAIAMLGLLLLRNRAGEGTALFAQSCAFLIAMLAVGTALLQATPLLSQENAEVLAVALPLNLGVAWGSRVLRTPSNSSTLRTVRKGAQLPSEA